MFKPLESHEVDKKISEIKELNKRQNQAFKPYLDAYQKTYGESPQGGIPRKIFTDPDYVKNLNEFKKLEEFPKGYKGPQGPAPDDSISVGPTGPYRR